MHFVHATRALDDGEEARLKALLDYGEPGSRETGRHRRSSSCLGSARSRRGPARPPTSPATPAWRPMHRIERGTIYTAGTEAWFVPWQGTRCRTRGAHRGRAARPDDGKRDRAVDRPGATLRGTGRQAGADRRGAGRRAGLPSAAPIGELGSGAVRRRDRLPRRCLHTAPPRSDRRRTDDVRAGELRALPPQDLQRGAGPSTASGRTQRCSA